MQLLSIFLHKTLLFLPHQPQKSARKGGKMIKGEILFTFINNFRKKP